MSMSKKSKVNKSGMSDSAKAEWRASKSAQLSGRLAAMKKVAAMPDPKARAPKRSYAALADAAAQPAGPPNVPASDATGANVGEPVANGENAHNPPAGEEVVREHTNRKGPQGKKEKQPKEGKRAPKAVKEAKPRADGCLTIAARLLAESKEPLGTKTLIEMMAAKGLWTSPGGKTPAATLYAAIVREISTKGENARFRKADRGLFAAGKGA
jgi:hypothetical protein